MEKTVVPFEDKKRFNRDYAHKLREAFEDGKITFEDLDNFLAGKLKLPYNKTLQEMIDPH